MGSRDQGCGLDNLAHLIKSEPRIDRRELARITSAEIAQKVRLHVSRRKELLLAAFAFLARAEKLLVQLGVVEAGHRSAVEI